VTLFLHLLPTRRLVAGSLLLCAAAGAHAVLLGATTRPVAQGQALDLPVRMLLEAGDDIAALCPQASVFYGDRKLDVSQIQITTEQPADMLYALVRIRSAVPVDGPVVTLQLQAGCTEKTMRRYVLLAAQGPAEAGADAQELRQMREELLKLQTALAESQAQLERAQAQGFPKEGVYGAIGVVSLVLAGLFFFWWRRRAEAAPATGSRTALLPESTVTSSTGTEPGVREWLFDSFKRSRAPASRDLPRMISALARRSRARLPMSRPVVSRGERVAGIFDLQQQVDFFSSLGQQQKAIELLRSHLAENARTSALVYLGLLELYHQTGCREDYEALRADFNHVFETRLGPFDTFRAAGPESPAYTALLARVEAAWPGLRVFDILDEALFSEPGDPAKVLDLDAYRELLLLHAVAAEIISLDSESGDGSVSILPLSEGVLRPPSSPRLGLDIDLSQWDEVSRTGPPEGSARPRRSGTAARSTDESTVPPSEDLDAGFRVDELARKP
jgi:hypothetical protein